MFTLLVLRTYSLCEWWKVGQDVRDQPMKQWDRFVIEKHKHIYESCEALFFYNAKFWIKIYHRIFIEVPTVVYYKKTLLWLIPLPVCSQINPTNNILIYAKQWPTIVAWWLSSFNSNVSLSNRSFLGSTNCLIPWEGWADLFITNKMLSVTIGLDMVFDLLSIPIR